MLGLITCPYSVNKEKGGKKKSYDWSEMGERSTKVQGTIIYKGIGGARKIFHGYEKTSFWTFCHNKTFFF
jgi:hypothetical protein